MRKTTDLSQAVGEELKLLDPSVRGSIFVHPTETEVFVSGELLLALPAEETLTEVLSRLTPGLTPRFALRGLGVLHAVQLTGTRESTHQDAPKLDEVSFLYSGSISPSLIAPSGRFKRQNPSTPGKLRDIVAPPMRDESGKRGKKRKQPRLVAPLILDQELRVVDGDLRLEVALSLGLDSVPVVIVGASEERLAALRILLNRSADYQRWLWEEVDGYLERQKEAHEYSRLKTLETLAVFGERLLPETFFGNTITEYEVHENSGVDTQQRFYRQEHGLAKWSKSKRKERAKEERKKAQKREAREAKKAEALLLEEENKTLNTGLFGL